MNKGWPEELDKPVLNIGAGGVLTPVDSQARFSEAVIKQWTWKTPAMQRMTLAVCELALAKAGGEFSANDLPEFKHGGQGIAGAVFNRLHKDGIIARVYLATDCPKVIHNAGGNMIGVYRLAGENGGKLARTLLKVHGGKVAEMKQVEML